MTTMERNKFYMNLSVTDAAYIAGLFDGEGCVTCKKKATNVKIETIKSMINGTFVVNYL